VAQRSNGDYCLLSSQKTIISGVTPVTPQKPLNFIIAAATAIEDSGTMQHFQVWNLGSEA